MLSVVKHVLGLEPEARNESLAYHGQPKETLELVLYTHLNESSKEGVARPDVLAECQKGRSSRFNSGPRASDMKGTRRREHVCSSAENNVGLSQRAHRAWTGGAGTELGPYRLVGTTGLGLLNGSWPTRF